MTHFSPRYNAVAEILDKHIETKTLVAFDHMRLPLSSFEWAYKINKLYRLCLKNSLPQIDIKSKFKLEKKKRQ